MNYQENMGRRVLLPQIASHWAALALVLGVLLGLMLAEVDLAVPNISLDADGAIPGENWHGNVRVSYP